MPYVQCGEEACIILHPSAYSKGYKRVVREGMCPKPQLRTMSEILLMFVSFPDMSEWFDECVLGVCCVSSE